VGLVNDKPGWFSLPGWGGDRTPAEQLEGLEALAEQAAGRTVLDLGCAEGAITRHFVTAWGAAFAHGLSIRPPEVRKARELCAGLPAKFWICDLRHWDEWLELHPQLLLPRYDIVLALSIAHKMRDPHAFFEQAAARAGTWLAVRLPARVHRDPRSGRVPIKPAAQLRGEFALVAEPATCRDEWLGIFRRR
jgi:trans-aconitate methyltransferase